MVVSPRPDWVPAYLDGDEDDKDKNEVDGQEGDARVAKSKQSSSSEKKNRKRPWWSLASSPSLVSAVSLKKSPSQEDNEEEVDDTGVEAEGHLFRGPARVAKAPQRNTN